MTHSGNDYAPTPVLETYVTGGGGGYPILGFRDDVVWRRSKLFRSGAGHLAVACYAPCCRKMLHHAMLTPYGVVQQCAAVCCTCENEKGGMNKRGMTFQVIVRLFWLVLLICLFAPCAFPPFSFSRRAELQTVAWCAVPKWPCAPAALPPRGRSGSRLS